MNVDRLRSSHIFIILIYRIFLCNCRADGTWMSFRDVTLHRLFGQPDARHHQLFGTVRAQPQVVDEAFNAGLVGGCGYNISSAEEEPGDAAHQQKKRRLHQTC